MARKRSVREVDQMDLMLMKELEVNARQSNAEIAAKLGTHRATILRRLEKLQTENIVTIVAIPNGTALRYHASATIGINVHGNNIDIVANELARLPNVLWVIVECGVSQSSGSVRARHAVPLRVAQSRISPA